MNPEAPEFQPVPSKIDMKNAWSNPARSVHIAKLPKRSENSQNISSKNLPPKEIKVLPQPAKLETEDDWKTVSNKKVKEDLTEEELEKLRQDRRERRQRYKESKKLKKQEQKLQSLKADKGTKIQVIDANAVAKMKNNPVKILHKEKEIKFFDEEYPSLGKINEKVEKKKSEPVKDSGSEWETDDEDSKKKTNLEAKLASLKKIEAGEKLATLKKSEDEVKEEKSFSSILKNSKKANPVLEELPDVIEVKKVKKKDPITFDIFAALQQQQNIKKVQKSSKVLGSKIQPQISVKNALDSSAPKQRRGKEREKPKKKRPTKMKKLIMLSRASKKQTLQQPQTSLKDSEKVEIEVEKISENVNTEVEKVPEKVQQVTEELKTIELFDTSPIEKAKLLMHSRKFRNYCDHFLSEELDNLVKSLVQDIVRFQDRQFAKDPVKAKAKKRYVVGLREIKKFLQVKKITLLLLAPDVETVKLKGGLDDTIEELIRLAQENEIPYAFTMNRWKLGKSCLRKVPISGIGVLNHQGSDENFIKIKELLPTLKSNYCVEFVNALKNVNAPNEMIDAWSIK